MFLNAAFSVVLGAALSGPKRILDGARLQLAAPASYTGEYFKLAYPGGDPPSNVGACTDVVIRAFRNDGVDLQKEIYEDEARVKYPGVRGSRDWSIDHRRCPNQRRFFNRFGKVLPIGSDFKPGDIVFWKLPYNKDHVGIVSDQVGQSGSQKVIHNMDHTTEEDVLHAWPVVGHYRWLK